MAVTELSPARARALADQPFTYTGVGLTRIGEAPPGYRPTTRTILVPQRDFDAVARDLMTWRVQSASGLRVATSTPKAEPGTVVVMSLGLGRLALPIPCRVVYVIDEPDRRGYAYGTLPGHPEAGEESFIVTRESNSEMIFEITAFSKPGTILAQAGGPLTRFVQHWMTTRYCTPSRNRSPR